MATLKEVAQRAGVTVTTVSRMLNKPNVVSESTTKRIRQAMKDLDYQPDEIAQSLSKKRSSFIGLIVPSARNSFFSKVIESTERHIARCGYKMLLCVSNHERKKEVEYFKMLKGNKVAGVIIASHTQDLAESITFGSPVISIDRTISPNIPAVFSDNYNGGLLAGRHLIQKGCKHIAYIGGGKVLTGMEARHRLQGFEAALAEYKMKPIVQQHTKDLFALMKYEEAIEAFFLEHGEVDGAFCSNDILAALILRRCAKYGIRVPEQMKVVGYDDVDLTEFCVPSLTSIRQPVDDICRFAVESLIHYKERSIPISTVFPVELIERESSR